MAKKQNHKSSAAGATAHIPFNVSPCFGSADFTRIRPDWETRSISAENPDGSRGGGAKARPGDDRHCSAASSELGQGWKVRPCIHIDAGRKVALADITGPGVIQHMWMTVLHERLRTLVLRIYYDGRKQPSIECPLGDFFANGADGCALIQSIPIAVNPRGGMNSYWPMPFRKRCRIEIANDGPDEITEFFYQITYSLQPVPDDAGYLHAQWRRSMTARDHPEHTILTDIRGSAGQYVGTYLVWNQFSNWWWGEGEVKFYIDEDDDNDGARHPTICGTGTEDYFGGAWGFRAAVNPETSGPVTYSTPFLGYPQALIGGEKVPCHTLYRWHIPDPIRFRTALRVTIQALGWYLQMRKFQPLTDDIASVAYWYQAPSANLTFPGLPPLNQRWPR